MKTVGCLTSERIQSALAELNDWFQEEGVEDNRGRCAMLLCEELLQIYQFSLGETADFIFEMKLRKGNLSVTLTVPGAPIDPVQSKIGGVYRVVLKQALDRPEWRYEDGKNIIDLVLPMSNTMRDDLKFAWRYTRAEKVRFFTGNIMQILAVAFNIISSFLIAKLIIHYTDELILQAVYTALAIFGLNLLEHVAIYISSRCYDKVAFSIISSVQQDLAFHVLNIRTSTVTSYGSGVFIQRMSTDVATFATGLNTIMELLINIGSFIGTLIAILLIEPAFFCYELLVLGLLFVVQKVSTERQIHADRVARDATDHYTGFVVELIKGFLDIRTLHCEDAVQEELKSRVSDSTEKRYIVGIKRWTFQVVSKIIFDIAGLIFMLMLAYCLYTGRLEAAMAVVLFNYNTKLGPDVISAVHQFTDFYTRFRSSSERINNLIFGQEFPRETFGAIHKERMDGKIEFRDVGFSYRGRAYEFYYSDRVFKGLSFTIQPKQMAAFVGASGCGKSTVFKLLNKLQVPDAGTILLDDVDINELDKDSLRSSIVIVNQDPYLFNTTLRDNFRFVKPDLTEEEMIHACQDACIHEDIMAMENGYDTIIGEGGVTLSGGQRQRVAIARGLLCDADIFALDEATSALDNNTQAHVLEAIRKVSRDHTVLLIAHRLSTIVDADVIFFIGDGKVIASGTHQQLMDSCSEYRKLYQAEMHSVQ